MTDELLKEAQQALEKNLLRDVEKLNDGEFVEKHILLLKLTNTLGKMAEFGSVFISNINTPQQSWISTVGALLSRISIQRKVMFRRGL